MMRFTYGASVQGTFKPSKGKFMFCAEGSTEFALAEGQAKVTGYFPDAEGHHVVARWFEEKKGEQSADLGYLQLALEVVLYGFAGASAMICVNTHFDAKGGLPALRGAFKEEDAGKKPGKKDDPMLQGAGVEGSLFAGVKAGCDVKLKLNWRNPEQKNEWRDLAEAGYGVAVAAGVAAEGEFKIEYENGKFMIRGHAGLVAGIGASGTVNCVVNVEKIIELIQFCYTELRKADFGFVPIFHPLAFENLSALVAFHFVSGIDTAVLVLNQWDDIYQWWKKRNVGKAEAKTLAININNDHKREKILRFATPEAQGKMLYILSETFWDTLEEQQEDAVIKLLKNFQSMRELKEAFEHMTPDGSSTKKWEEGEARIVYLLDGEQQEAYTSWKDSINGKADPNGPVRVVHNAPYERKSPWKKAKKLKRGRFAVA